MNIQKPELLTEFFQVRITKNEKDLITEIAKAEGVTESVLCRNLIRYGLEKYQDEKAKAN